MSIAFHADAPSTGIWLQVYPGLGVPALVIASGGTHGPSHLLNDLSLPADADKEYRFAIVTPPASCTLALYPDGSYIATPPPGTVDLTDSFVYRLLEDGTDLGTATQIIVIGAGTAGSYTATMSALSAGVVYAGFAATYAAPGGGSYTATMADVVASAAYGGFAASYAAPGSGAYSAAMASLSVTTTASGFAAVYVAPTSTTWTGLSIRRAARDAARKPLKGFNA